MSISRDQILLDNVKASLDLYQRSLTWGITASLSAALLALRLRSGTGPSVSLLTTQISAGPAMLIAIGLTLLFGAFAYFALRRYIEAMEGLSPNFSEDATLLNAILLNPSLATSNRFFSIGSALVPIFVTIFTWIIDIPRERQDTSGSDWVGYFIWMLVFIAPYASIVLTLVRLPRWHRPSD